MKQWVLGVLALIAAVFAVTLTRSRPTPHPAVPVDPTPPAAAAPAREPAAAGPPVVDVVDLAAELDRPAAADGPFVPFDGPAFPGLGPGAKGVPAGAF